MPDIELTHNNITIHERLACLETQVEAIISNHLPHLQRRIDALDTKFYAIISLLIINLTAVIASYLSK